MARPPKTRGGRAGPPKAKAAKARPPRSRKKPAGPPRRPPVDRRAWWRAEALTWLVGVALGLALAGGILWLDARQQVLAFLAAPPRPQPTTVWSAPIRVKRGDPYPLDDLEADLLAAGYERAPKADAPGRFAVQGDRVEVWTAALDRGGQRVPEQRGEARVVDGRVVGTEPAAGLLLRPTALAVVGDLEARRSAVTLETVSPWMAPALLAIEDARFRDHVGVDPIGVARALVRTLLRGDLQGGSTLTQQLAKNLFLDRERTVRRKVREVFLATALEAALDKDALLELYLSEVYLGHVGGVPVHGVEQAARTWFGKSARHLSPGEAATIAGTIASPNTWSPLRDPDAALERRQQVIRRMVYVRAITEAQAEAALAEPLATLAPPSAGWRAPWAVDAALDALTDHLGDGARLAGGLDVWTSVQPHVQRAAVAAVRGGLAALEADLPEAASAEGALVVVDAGTGDVVAIVGGRDFLRSPFHRATRARRQAGSTVKPLLLLAALEADPALGPSSLLDDAPLERRYDGRTWRPRNADGRFLGPIPLRRALELSRNAPAVLLSERVGLGAQRRAFQAAGLAEATDLPSAALGAFPTTPLQLAGAYTVFPGGGVVRSPRVLRAVTDAGGRVRADVPVASERLASPASAALATSMLQGVLTHGTGRRVAALGVGPGLAGKTGTTDGGRDAWFVGFDGRWVAAAWVGADRGELGLGGAEAALPVWAAFMVDVGAPRRPLPRPDGLTSVDVCPDDGRPACGRCPEPRAELFRAGHAPAADCAAPAAEEGVAPDDTPQATPEAADDAPAADRRRARRGPHRGRGPREAPAPP